MELLFSISDILGDNISLEQALFIVVNLIIIESLLSVDNAAVLATMVMDLPESQRGRALKYGIIGAYVFRGLCLLFASWLVNIWWLKPLGGLYLLYLAFDYFKSSSTESKEDDTLNKNESIIYKYTLGFFGQFWATVAMVEVMDLAFSIDNVFAAVAFTGGKPELMPLVYLGVFIGILAMRFVAQFFVRLMERFPFLETSAFLVIGILGVKLMLSLITHFYEGTAFQKTLDSESTDLIVSIGTVLIFVIPIVTSSLFGFPSRKTEAEPKKENA